jgi:hypothetical protein
MGGGGWERGVESEGRAWCRKRGDWLGGAL